MTFTKRNLIWLYALGLIGKRKYGDNDYWVNYKEVHKLVGEKFGKFDENGVWKPMVLSSYGRMADKPYELIENDNQYKEKFKSKGDWRLSKKGILFINDSIQIPEEAQYNWQGCYNTSRMIFANEVKAINFTGLVEEFGTF
jgi:hypothetical protein